LRRGFLGFVFEQLLDGELDATALINVQYFNAN
jgi:hypothetical protein